MTQQFDLIVRNGTVVTASAHGVTDIGIRSGKIMQLGGDMSSDSEIEASGYLVLPGGIDMHVHLTPVVIDGQEWSWSDDFYTGTCAAAAGGVTTVGNMAFPLSGERLVDTIERTRLDAESQSIIDFLLHPVVLDPTEQTRTDLETLAESGLTSVKIFMILGNFDGRALEYLDIMRHAGTLGMMPMVHCEDNCVIGHVTARLLQEGKSGVEHYASSRPVFSEEIAVTRAIGFAEAAETPIYIVHLSSKLALEACRRARSRGLPIYVETRPLYLYLTEDRFLEADGAKYVGSPPLRTSDDLDALWHSLWASDIQSLGTDHAPWKIEEKTDPDLNIETFRPGVADLETLMPMLFSAGVKSGKLSLSRFVEITSTNAARLFGLYPQKGTIAVGSDADLVIWDSNLTKEIDGASMISESDYSPYDGWTVSGWPRTTISRGVVVYSDGAIAADAGHGRLVQRGSSQRL